MKNKFQIIFILGLFISSSIKSQISMAVAKDNNGSSTHWKIYSGLKTVCDFKIKAKKNLATCDWSWNHKKHGYQIIKSGTY